MARFKHPRKITAFVVFIVGLASCATAQVSSKREATIPNVLNEVQKALVKAQTQIADLGMPPLKSVTLTLQTGLIGKGGPKADLVVVSLGQTWQKERSQELILELIPPEPYTPIEIASKPELSDQIVEAIVSAATGVQAARSGKPPLLLNSLQAEFTFVIDTETHGGLAFKIIPVSLDLGGELKSKALHKIKVIFERSKK